MKTILCFTLTLLTFITLTFIPNSFAQDASPEYVVRVLYFIPNDREPDPDIDTKLNTLIKDAQMYFADVMEHHGFERKTFRFEADDVGNVVVHHVNGNYSDAYYKNPAKGIVTVWQEIEAQFDMSKSLYLCVLDISSDYLPSGNSGGAVPINSLRGRSIVPASRPTAAAHEIGHMFGLSHDKRIDADRIYESTHYRNIDWMTSSFSAAEWLDLHPYFNPVQKAFNENTSVKMLTPSLASPPDNIRLQVEVTDPDGIHQVQWYIGGLFDSVIAYEKVKGENIIVELVTNEVIGGEIVLGVIDVHGNWSAHVFTIDINDLLPTPTTVSIPDDNLAAAIRETLRISSRQPITQLNMWTLLTLRGNERRIMDLTGLEHARNLKYLYLLENQISDITPLAKLHNLIEVDLKGNEISDITPVKELMQLRSLELDGNKISDISLLKGLTHLRELGLSFNKIRDITSLTGLTRLWMLGLSGNQIGDITPIASLTNLFELSLYSNKTSLSNLAPLAKLTNLNHLHLVNNNISNITPLAGLTNLVRLRLSDNQIRDVSPLVELTNLKELFLVNNQIKNRKLLLNLLRKNPDIEIYLKNYHEPLPVTLSHFRAELTDTGVVLKWTTESEVDNAGFYIYRSETRDGEFKVVNPTMIQGAGTSSERNAYTWTDATAKPNITYYYQIEDISHAGVRQQLATVRMRGLVSASGKLTTIWGDLKTLK